VKIHGYRIELGEVEETLKRCPGIQQAIVIAREDQPGDKRLVAYFTGNADEQEIKLTLNHHLPHYMLPSAFVQLMQFPLTPNGKVDRGAFPTPIYILEEKEYLAPRNTAEKEIAKIFEDLLQIEKVSIDSTFFSLGGHSLLAAQAITKINRTFHCNLPLKTLFEKSTIALIAKEVELSLRQGDKSLNICRAPRDETFNLSYSQQWFWFLDQQIQDSALYTIPFLLEFTGDLDISILQKALHIIVHRHEILRTIFRVETDVPEQIILSIVGTDVRYKDLRDHKYPEEDAKRLIEAEAKRPFDLTQGPLFRFLLMRTKEKHYHFFLNFHHIIFDGYSIGVFVNELKILYESYKLMQANPLKDLETQYMDYTHWQSNIKNRALEEELENWWFKKLNDAPQFLNLPIDRPRPHIQTYSGALFEFAIVDQRDILNLKHLAQQHESTLFMVLLAAFHVFLSRYTGQSDIMIGIPVSGRTHHALDSLIGCFVNTLPLRTQSLRESAFLDLLKCVREWLLEALEHQDIPFEKIINKLKIERSLSHASLFQVMFSMVPAMEITQIEDLHLCLQNIDRGMAHFDLSLTIQETSDSLLGTFEYNTDLFLKETIVRMSGHFQKLVREIVVQPQQSINKLQFLSDAEVQKQTIAWNLQPVIYPKNDTILQQIEKWAADRPDALAVVCGVESVSYHQLNVQANQVAHTLLELGIQSEQKAVICLERSTEFISAVLGVLKAGGVYVPMDSSQPTKRINSLLQDLHPICILTNSSSKIRFSDFRVIYIDQLPVSRIDNPLIAISQEQLAYIIYTSGSTGKPKGVEIEHKSINDRVFWKNAAYPLTPDDVVLHTYSFIFDGAIINYFWPLCVGATLVISTPAEQFDPTALIQLVRKYNITTIDLLPYLLQGLLEQREIAACHSLKNVFSGGEALLGTIVQLFYVKCPFAKLHNTYGPTETTVEASAWECEPEYAGAIAPIGKPIAGAKLYILDQSQNILPIGIPGELYIGGIGLARGYLNDPSLTAEKFISNPFSPNPDDRLYRTGDLVKYSQEGNIEFLGRIDNQVKIRGYRIDLWEIESAILHMDPVEKVIVRVNGSDLHKHLVAYVTLSLSMKEEVFFKLMKHYLGEHLPAYMIPQHIVVLDTFPTLSNGKINYKALPISKHADNITCSFKRECKNELESQMLSVWKEVLDFEGLSVTDNFFDIGGNSLLAMRLMARIKNKIGISIPLIHLFQYPTIEALSASLNIHDPEKYWSPIVLMQPKGSKEPFFCVHPVGGGV
ncbi:MAG TPA: amino acid adenylation domain-containing protein, partial [Waddliaceae bacterium]